MSRLQPDKLKTWRRSVAAILQLPRSPCRLSGFIQLSLLREPTTNVAPTRIRDAMRPGVIGADRDTVCRAALNRQQSDRYSCRAARIDLAA